MDLDPFNEDKAELCYMKSKPTCFIIFGKPCAGKYTLARKFCRQWNCRHISIPLAVEFAIATETPNGLVAKKLLHNGGVISEELCLAILRERLNAVDVQHYGYCLQGIPFLSPNPAIVEEQFSLIKELAPDYVINLKISDADLSDRCYGLKTDPLKGTRYIKAFYASGNNVSTSNSKTELAEEEGEGEGEDEEEDEEDGVEVLEDSIDQEEKGISQDVDAKAQVHFVQELLEELELEEDMEDLIQRLVTQVQDFNEAMQNCRKTYKDLLRDRIEDYIESHDTQKIVELDANLPTRTMYRNLINCLEVTLLSRAIKPIRLQGGEEQEEIPEDTDTDDMLRSLAASDMIAPGYRWRRSKWGRLCPVALSEGLTIMGTPPFSVSFCDKMYLMSSEENLIKFMLNPRRYLLPPQPSPPCKLVVLGQAFTGTTSLSLKLADRYGCKYINVDELAKPLLDERLDDLKKKQMEHLIDECVRKIQSLKNTEELARKSSVTDEDANSEGSGAEGTDGSESEQKEQKVDEEPSPAILVDESHPMVQALIEEGIKQLIPPEVKLSPEEYVDILENELSKLYEGTDKGPSAGGWLIDNFPLTRDQFNVMVDRGIVPDDVICIRDDNNENETLVDRWNEEYRKGEEMLNMTDQERDELKKFKDSLILFDRNWTAMQSGMRNANNIEPMLLFTNQSIEECFQVATKTIEISYKYHGWEYTGMDQDEEEEDMAAEDEDEEEEAEEMDRKPYGETKNFCPVMLKKEHVLWPGSQDIAVKYRERVYFCSSQEARDEFLLDPEDYLPQNEPLQIPPVRLLLLGAKGSGKSLHGKLLAKKFGVFHISFQDRLQELIIHKTQKRIGPDYENEDDGNEEDDIENSDKNMELELDDDEEVTIDSVDFDEFEESIRSNILESEPFSEENLLRIIELWWKEEPFKSRGFILEGFPRTTEEARILSTNGLFPDGAISLTVDDNEISQRLMPPIFEKWKTARDKRSEARLKKFEEKSKLREEERVKRRAEKVLERDETKAERTAARQAAIAAGEEVEEEEEDEQGDEDEEDDIDEIVEMELLEEFGPLEEEEDEEETEEEAVERIKLDITEKYEEQLSDLEGVQETLEDAMIPRIDVEAGRKSHITQYILMKMLKPQVQYRSSLFDRCQTVSAVLAKKLLLTGYKQASRFGHWCPVKLYDGDHLPPYVSRGRSSFPVVYRQHVYFLSSEENKERFIQTPQVFLQQPTPSPLVPIKVAVIGPPKSGKTTLANRFVRDLGVVRLSMGEAVRRILETHQQSNLVKQINTHLLKGCILPDELAVQALKLCLMDVQCLTRGFVLDGYPLTMKQVGVLREHGILPSKIICLNVTDKTIMKRGVLDRNSADRAYPLHDSLTNLAIRVASYRRESEKVQEYYEKQHRNLFELDSEKSKWWIYNTAVAEIQKSVCHISSYIKDISFNKASSIYYLCITPQELQNQLGHYGEYDPVSLANENALVNCTDIDLTSDLVAEYNGHYYKFSTAQNMSMFLETPEKYVPPLAPHSLPPEEDLPKRRDASFMKEHFPLKLQLKGYCPVTFKDGKLRYEAIIPGDPDLIVEYKKKFYSLASEHHVDKFMRYPNEYDALKLPAKVPPKRDPINVAGLPMLGYLEQTVSNGIIKALTAVGCLKPKYPFLSAKRSALLYVAYHLKAYNPKANDYSRRKYKRKLEEFEDHCQLIVYLSRIMKRKYMEPEDRPIDFDLKLSSFAEAQSAY